MSADIHTCSYQCDRPACIRAQRDELAARLNEPSGNSGQLPPAGEAVEMSPEFTDTARAALAWVLWHHQGGSSPVGQPIRFALGMGAHDPLPDWRITEAVRYANLFGWTTDDFHRTTPPAAQVQQEAVAYRWWDGAGWAYGERTPFGNRKAEPLYTHPAAADALGAVRAAAVSMRELAKVIRKYGTCAPAALELVASRIEAAIAQAPAVRVTDEMVELACEAYLAEAKRQNFNPSEAWARSQQAKDWMRAALEAALGQGKAS